VDKVGTSDDAEAMLDYGNLSPRDVAPIRAIWWLNGWRRAIISTTMSRNEVMTRDKLTCVPGVEWSV